MEWFLWAHSLQPGHRCFRLHKISMVQLCKSGDMLVASSFADLDVKKTVHVVTVPINATSIYLGNMISFQCSGVHVIYKNLPTAGLVVK